MPKIMSREKKKNSITAGLTCTMWLPPGVAIQFYDDTYTELWIEIDVKITTNIVIYKLLMSDFFC